MFRRRLSIALGLLAATAVAEGLGAAAALSVAELQVERGRVASDIRTAFVELSATKQRLRSWVAQRQQGGGGTATVRVHLQRDMRLTLERLSRLSTAALALDDSALTRDEHLRRLEALQVLSSSVAELEEAVNAAQPLSPGTDAQQAWLALSAVFDRSQGRDVRQLIDDSVARESEAVRRERSAADASLAWLRGLWLSMAATLAVLAVVAALYFNLALRRPMDLLGQGAQALREGRLQHRIRLGGADEFSAVAHSFNTMAAELERHRLQETQQRQRLEAQVDARTAELRDALQALGQADLRRRQLFADVSHELRTPTTVIRGEAEITLRGADRPAGEYKATLRRIVETAGQLAEVIDDLLAMARSDIDALSLVKRPLDLIEPVREALLQAAALGAARGIRLPSVDGWPTGGTVMGDSQRLRQLLLILLDNAVRYSAAGGEVRVRLLPAAQPGAPCGIEIANDGAGIAAHELPRVFERHYRGDAARQLCPEGAGLGLAIARSLARAHAGTIELSSAPGVGTVARLLLPSAGRDADRARHT
ncbi:ATP-binding protein [Leptothrix sp. BB-4]